MNSPVMAAENGGMSLRKRSKVKKTLGEILGDWQLYVLLLPAFAAVLVFHYIPIYGVQIAFKNYRTSLGILGSEWIGFKNFIRFLEYPDFWRIVGNTLTLSLYTLATFPISVILALMLNEVQHGWYKKLVQMVTYAPHFISFVVLVSMMSLMFGKTNGLINNVITSLGGERIPFMESSSLFKHMYVWSGVWQGMGWGAIIYIAALAGVPQELIEAAKIDGAGRFRIIWNINIPTILPTIMTMLILNTGHVLSVGFEKVYLMQNSLNLDSSRIISTYVYEIGIIGGQFSYSSAIGLFNSVVNVIVISLVNMLSKKLTDTGLF